MSDVFVIAEAGVNHNGREDLALALIDAAHATGADAVKFQTFTAKDLVAPGTAAAAYQTTNTAESDQYRLLEQLELPDETFVRLAARCAELGIEFMSTAFTMQAIDQLVRLGVRRMKVPSGEITNKPYIQRVAATRLPMIVSSGMATLDEVRDAVGWCRAAGNHDVTLLHCTSSYPAAVEDANLRVLNTLLHAFGRPVGYSDHTLGIQVSAAAVALGASVIEKHITLDRTLPGPDHRASLEPAEFTQLVQAIRTTAAALGSPDKRPVAAELDTRKLVRRSIAASRDLRAGDTLRLDDLVMLRPADGIPPAELERVVGRRLNIDVRAGSTLKWPDIGGM